MLRSTFGLWPICHIYIIPQWTKSAKISNFCVQTDRWAHHFLYMPPGKTYSTDLSKHNWQITAASGFTTVLCHWKDQWASAESLFLINNVGGVKLQRIGERGESEVLIYSKRLRSQVWHWFIYYKREKKRRSNTDQHIKKCCMQGTLKHIRLYTDTY